MMICCHKEDRRRYEPEQWGRAHALLYEAPMLTIGVHHIYEPFVPATYTSHEYKPAEPADS
eukprot:1584524-Pleurochrysis_carterae.AAC.1